MFNLQDIFGIIVIATIGLEKAVIIDHLLIKSLWYKDMVIHIKIYYMFKSFLFFNYFLNV